tara:strand:- start:15 stop:353 length:339 start_codon:yes stop_codon:yes gene_type:complete
MPVFQILEKIHLQNHTLEYEKLFILNRNPQDKELSKHLQEIARKKLSPFDDYYNRETHCYYAFKHPRGGLLTSKDPDILFNIIQDAGYKVDIRLLQVMKKKDRGDIFCFISK